MALYTTTPDVSHVGGVCPSVQLSRSFIILLDLLTTSLAPSFFMLQRLPCRAGQASHFGKLDCVIAAHAP